MTVRRTAAALVVVPLLTLASCGGDPHKPPPLTVYPSPTQSSSTPTGPVAPTLPAAATKHTRAGAEAYVRYYVDVLNYTTTNGDPAALAKISPKDCLGCQSILKVARSNFESGSTVKGGLWTIKTFARGYPRAGSEQSIITLIDAAPSVVTQGDGTKDTYSGDELHYTIETAWSSDLGWRLTWLHSD